MTGKGSTRPLPIDHSHWQNAHRWRAPRSSPQHVLLLSAQVEIKLCGSQTSWKRAEGIVWKSAKCRPKVDNAEWPLKPAPCPLPLATFLLMSFFSSLLFCIFSFIFVCHIENNAYSIGSRPTTFARGIQRDRLVDKFEWELRHYCWQDGQFACIYHLSLLSLYISISCKWDYLLRS